jgi:competence protein ComEC
MALGLGAWIGLRAALWLPAAWLAWALTLGLAIAALRQRRVVLARGAALLALGLTALLRAQLAQVAPQPADLPLPRTQPPIQQIEVLDEPAWTPTGQRFTARWQLRCAPPPDPLQRCEERRGLLRVDVRGREVQARRGQLLRVPAFVAPPPAYRNPGCVDMAENWQRQGVVGSLHVAHAQRLAVVEVEGGLWQGLVRGLGAARRWLGLRIQAAMAGEEAAVVSAMTLGDRGTEWPLLDQWLRDTGTAHILAVSGSHLALVLTGLRWLLRLVVVRFGRELLRRAPLALWVGAPLIAAAWAYVGLTGAAAATVRSAWMATAVVVGQCAAAKPDPWELLGLALSVALVIEPAAVDDVGLQLSAAGVAGLLWSSHGDTPRGVLAQAWRASLGAFALTSAVAALRMGQVAWLSVPVNLLAVPYAALLLPACLLISAGAALDLPVQVIAQGVVWPLRWAVEHTAGLWPVGHLDGVEAALLALWLPLSLAALWHPPKWRIVAALAGVALAGYGAGQIHQGIGKNTLLRLTFLDVGHGDATLVQWPDGRAWLVDGGGAHDDDGRTGDRAVLPALRALGVRHLDVAVLTHAHPDHENGLLAVARALPVGRWWWNGQPAGGAEHRELLKLWGQIRESNLGRWAGEGRRLGEAVVRVLWPDATHWPWRPGLSHNDNSLVLQLEAAGHRVLLSGDIEREAEWALVQSGAVGRVGVLKVPHHGSRTSSTPPFLAATAPLLAIAGARPWGQLPFPHPEVAQRYRDAAIRLWSTSDGAVTVDLHQAGWTARQGQRELQVTGRW